MPSIVSIAARLLVVGYCWATLLYALVASSTFAYLQFLRPRVFPWTGTFADWHATIAWPWLALLTLVVWPDVRRRWWGRPLARLLLAACACAVAWTAIRPVLPSLSNDGRSLRIAVGALVPVLWLTLLDLLRDGGMLAGTPGGRSAEMDRRLLHACLLTALTVTAAFGLLALARVSSQFEPDLLLPGTAYALWRSLALHVTVCMALFLGAAWVARLGGGNGGRQWWCWSAVFVAAVAILFDRTLANVLSLAGGYRAPLAIVAGLATVGPWAGIQLSRRAGTGPAADALEWYFGPARPGRPSAWPLATALSGLSAWMVQRVAARADWDDLVLRLGTIVIWVAVFAWAYRRACTTRSVSNAAVLVACVVPLGGVAAVSSTDAARRAAHRYEVYDPSYRLARGLLAGEPATPATFNRYLRANTGLTDVTVAPRSIDLVADLRAATRTPPIFLFIVDSLRHDYLGAYNPKASFTPNIDAFAAESVVFTNAFTRYGGTGLSLPAIWAGSALPHKQYVTPFHPMNALEKLLDANGYRRFISLDSIMVRLLESTPLVEELDRGVTVMDYELCRTLGELETKLASAPRDAPLFAYSLPQDVHMSRLGRWPTPPGDFKGFFAPYAGRIQAMDRCFGQFVGALKRLGLYDGSLIVLTSDHGEMLGENGQFGHSYHMVPQVVRVPLILHLPAGTPAAGLDPAGLALSTDITPTIYAALGYHPAAEGPLTGRALIGQDDEAIARRRQRVTVLAASYGAVYAVVRDNGRRLYVADAVRNEDHVYERTGTGPWVEGTVSPDVRAVEQYAIRRHIDETARVFNLPLRE